MPARETRPTVGLMPYSAARPPGHIIEPSVSVPSATGPNPALTPTALPELLPQGSPPAGNLPSTMFGLMFVGKDPPTTYADCVCPPRADQPAVLLRLRKWAHSLMFVFPRMIAPASRNFSMTVASLGTKEPTQNQQQNKRGGYVRRSCPQWCPARDLGRWQYCPLRGWESRGGDL